MYKFYRITGAKINQYFVCKRQLWLSSKKIEMEQTSDAVALGKIIHEKSYSRKLKEIEIGSIKIDFLESKCEVHEVKKSRKMEKAHEWQMLYYLFYLKDLGITATGIINYPILRKRVKVILTPEKEKELKKIIMEIKKIVSSNMIPRAERKPYCKKCSYYELCWC
ncbi:MAG: CRISPR-associated protein Cas4 [Candidatus Parvarchaeota archaeon]|nr:CRISPR-associated protein Cas4 [Candidatus Jingweiarchaeum tengchongense]MCW1304941.1 CRISPR-associated protein Cas4 [Candidatus Jingweiarchaeum tengchongense]MCW1305499.1 CRISPR-associated protein Cas4 [Candidatus Jingweiarchaeum tengchongense]